jgi:hypothetical protein
VILGNSTYSTPTTTESTQITRACCPSASVRNDNAILHGPREGTRKKTYGHGVELRLGVRFYFLAGRLRGFRYDVGTLALLATHSQTRANPQPRRPPPGSMSSAPSSTHAATAKATLPAPVSSSHPSTIYSTLRRGTLREFLMTEVDPDRSTIPLAAYCFMTGWMSVSLSATILSPSLTLYHLIVTWCPSPPSSFGVHSKLATRYRCVYLPRCQPASA